MFKANDEPEILHMAHRTTATDAIAMAHRKNNNKLLQDGYNWRDKLPMTAFSQADFMSSF
jgi:hypothetical protein